MKTGTLSQANMDASLLSGVTDALLKHGYLFLFLAMCLEGPFVTIAAATAAALGHFSIPGIFFVSIAGDIAPDILYYAIGFFAGTPVIERWGGRLGLPAGRVRHIRSLLNIHKAKAIIAIKFTPLVPMIGLMSVGAFRLQFVKFLTLCLIVTIPRSLLLIALGYQFGWAINALSPFFRVGELVGAGIFALGIMFVGYNAIARRISRWADSITAYRP